MSYTNQIRESPSIHGFYACVRAAARLAMTVRAGRWVRVQVGRHGRSVNEVAADLGCDWHTIIDVVAAYGQALIDDPGRSGDVEAIGIDETLMFRLGPWKRQQGLWSTSNRSSGKLVVTAR